MAISAAYRTALQRGVTDLHLEVSETAQEKLLQYVQLLEKWNRVYNLTAVRDIAEMIPKHILDSLAVLPWVRAEKILDVGTGAGLPGLVWAVVQPSWQYVLVDSNAKKIRFVQQAAIELGLNNVTAKCARLENYHPEQLFDSIVSRAFAELRTFYDLTHQWCAPDGILLAMKGTYPQAELLTLENVAVSVQPLTVPQLDAQRHLVILTKH